LRPALRAPQQHAAVAGNDTRRKIVTLIHLKLPELPPQS
jgi:hypothetical protein